MACRIAGVRIDDILTRLITREWSLMKRRRMGALAWVIGGTVALTSLAANAAAAPKRSLEVEDFDRLAAVDGVVCSATDARSLTRSSKPTRNWTSARALFGWSTSTASTTVG